MSSSSKGNHEVETARKRLQAATTHVVSTTTNLQMQQKNMEMQKLLLDNAQSMANAANKEYNDALAMLASVEKRCGITSSDEQQQMKKAAAEGQDNVSIEHKIYTNHAPPQSIIDQGEQQSKELLSESSNKRRKVSVTSTTAATASTLGQSSMSNNSRGKDLSQMQKAISNRSSSIAAATTTTAVATANSISTGTTSSTLPMNVNQLLYGHGMPPYLVNNGMLPQTNAIGNRTEPSLDQLSRTGNCLNMMARPPPPVVHTNTSGTTAHRISINDNNTNESVKHSWLGLAEETKETIRLEAEKTRNISAVEKAQKALALEVEKSKEAMNVLLHAKVEEKLRIMTQNQKMQPQLNTTATFPVTAPIHPVIPTSQNVAVAGFGASIQQQTLPLPSMLVPKQKEKPPDYNLPPKPYTEYTIFFKLEQAYLTQTEGGSGVAEEVKESLIPGHHDPLEWPRPKRYQDIVMAPYWYSSLHKAEIEKKRKHRKLPGRMSLSELSKTISANWKKANDDVVEYCRKLADAEQEKHNALVKETKIADARSNIL